MIFLLIFNMLFTSFSYALTAFPDEPEPVQTRTKLPSDDLAEFGIYFTDAEEYNIAFNDGYHYYETNKTRYRFAWDDGAFTLDSFVFQKQNWVGYYLDNWFFRTEVEVKFLESGQVYNIEGVDGTTIWNTTIVNEWEFNQNWSRMKIDNNIVGLFSLISPDANVTQAIFDTGRIFLTVGTTLKTTETYSFDDFKDWYWATVFGYDYSGIPSSLSWMMRGLTALNILVAVFAIRDLTKL